MNGFAFNSTACLLGRSWKSLLAGCPGSSGRRSRQDARINVSGERQSFSGLSRTVGKLRGECGASAVLLDDGSRAASSV